jgi:hypothetical protein
MIDDGIVSDLIALLSASFRYAILKYETPDMVQLI